MSIENALSDRLAGMKMKSRQIEQMMDGYERTHQAMWPVERRKRHRYGIDLGDGWVKTDQWGVMRVERLEEYERNGLIVIEDDEDGTTLGLPWKFVQSDKRMVGTLTEKALKFIETQQTRRRADDEALAALVEEAARVEALPQAGGRSTDSYKW